jgi:hypothetical protein
MEDTTHPPMSGAILVDSRSGSRDLARYIVPKAKVRVVSGLPTDVISTGNGPGGERVEWGLEHKTLPDVLACINSGRFSGTQLEPLCEFDFAFLLIEGLFRRAGDERGGRIEVGCQPAGKSEWGWYDTAECGWGSRVWHHIELSNWLTTIRLKTRGTRCGGVVVLPFEPNKYSSGQAVGELWQWFNAKEWEDHRAHLQSDKTAVAALRGKLPLVTRAAIEIEGLGDKGAVAVERTFGSLKRAVNASVDEWAAMMVGGQVAGGRVRKAHRLGKKRAAAVVAEIEGR